MAKAWQYPRWRYYLMQAVMWGVLAAMVGAAGLVDHHRRQSLEVKLTRPQTKRNLTLQLPEGWTSDRKLDSDSHVLFELHDPNLPRTLQIIREPSFEFVSPARYLIRQLGKESDLDVEPLTIANTPGTLVKATIRLPSREGDDSEDERHAQIVSAATVLPSGHGVSVELISAGTPMEMDVTLVKRIAASIEAHGEPKMSDDDLRLRDGTTIDVPDGWSAISQQDPNRSAREIRMQPGGANLWRGVTLIPIVMLPNDGPHEIETLCAVWSSTWRPARTVLLGPRRWRIDRATENWSDYAVTRIYVMGDGHGHGLMAVFEGNGSDDGWIEPLWKLLSDGTKFPQSSDLPARIATGAQLVAQIREHGLGNFVGETRPETWWLYCRESPDHPVGWFRDAPTANPWRQTCETRLTLPDRGDLTLQFQCEGSANLASYTSDVQHKEFASGGGSVDEVFNKRVSFTASDGKLQFRTLGTDVDPDRATASVDPTPIFLPGGWAQQLIGKLPEKPMLLETESFVYYEDVAGSSLLRLIITPTSDVAHSGLADAKPLRCVNVEANGSGETSRWYFRADGSLDSIDYADGFRRIKSDLPTLRNSFPNPFMKP